MDNRLGSGVLNFTIAGSVTFKPECMSYYGMDDYWYGGGLQSNFNIHERVSLKLNNGRQ